MKAGRQIVTALGLLLLFFLVTQASNSNRGWYFSFPTDSLPPSTLPAQPRVSPSQEGGQKERIFIEHVDVWRYDRDLNPDAQILMGNVKFRHNDAYMYCDSALLYEETNRFEAYNNVRIEQGDSLFIFCDYLDYDGTLMLARLREFVRMEHGGNTLYTDSLDYDRVAGIGYYFDYGSIVDSLNILTSVYGEYSTVTKKAVFNDSVVLENPNFTLKSDTLHYDTETKIATILGPTEIIGDSGVIHATRGVYDTELDRAYLMDGPEIESDTRWMTGDSIFYDREAQTVEMYRNVELRDTADRVSLHGQYAEYHEDSGYGLARDRAYISDYSSTDTLYIHALLLEMNKVDSVATLFKGLGNVRLYRSDMQAASDTLTYQTADSLMHFIGNPFIWSGQSQVTGDTISIYMKNEGIDYAHIRQNAFLSSRVTDEYFNQMRGRDVFAYFSDNKMDSVWVHGNSEVIYISLSKDSIPQELTQTQSSQIFMGFENEEIVKIKMQDRTVGTMTPVHLLQSSQLTFPDFLWFPEGRPRGFADIFRITPQPAKKTEGGRKGEEEPEQSTDEQSDEQPDDQPLADIALEQQAQEIELTEGEK